MAPERKPVPEVRADGRDNRTPPGPAPVELTNVVCARCDAALWYSPARWLFCPRCTTNTKLGTK